MIFSRFFASPSGFLLFRTGSDTFFREDFLQIIREGQERRPFHREIIQSTFVQDFCLIIRKYAAETAA